MTRRGFRALALAIASVALASAAAAQPIDQPLDAGWRFTRGERTGAEQPPVDDTGWERVDTPHSWNAGDWDSPAGYYRGTGWYRRALDVPAAWQGRRVFVRFGAAGAVADVFVNGRQVGHHRGAFSAFAVEVTSAVTFGGPNVLAVRVNNERRDDMPPLSGDFNIFGGLYRRVTLHVRDQVGLDLLDHGSWGLQVRQMAVSAERADLDVRVRLANAGDTARDVDVVVRVSDAEGRLLASSRRTSPVPAARTIDLTQPLVVERPRLWDGMRDPHLHVVTVEVLADGRRVDGREERVGFRSFRIDEREGFFLNGRPYPLRGVNRHQDLEGRAWAISEADERADLAMILEIGANTVRLAHYQHSEHFYRLCDEAGLVTWAEIPLVNAVNTWPEFTANARQQLVELVRQNINRTSIAMWSVHNEVGLRTRVDPGPLVGLLHAVARAEDPTRPSVGAMHGVFGAFRDTAAATTLVAVNLYPGWYSGTLADMGPWIDRWNRDYGLRGLAVSEYGAGASPDQHEQGMTKNPVTTGKWHPEEWQAKFHEETYAAIAARPFVWGSFVWAMFDFSSAGRTEGDRDAVNDKGLVTYDRRLRKDAFHFYKANWNPEPMVYIASRRHTERTEALTEVKVYANCGPVRLSVNGAQQPAVAPNAVKVSTWPAVRLRVGVNTIEAACPAGGPRDTVAWTLVAGTGG